MLDNSLWYQTWQNEYKINALRQLTSHQITYLLIFTIFLLLKSMIDMETIQQAVEFSKFKKLKDTTLIKQHLNQYNINIKHMS